VRCRDSAGAGLHDDGPRQDGLTLGQEFASRLYNTGNLWWDCGATDTTRLSSSATTYGPTPHHPAHTPTLPLVRRPPDNPLRSGSNGRYPQTQKPKVYPYPKCRHTPLLPRPMATCRRPLHQPTSRVGEDGQFGGGGGGAPLNSKWSGLSL
jgi:hypothetical protein